MQLPGLTKEAFLALRQTCHALTELTKHLINFCGFKYVLLGKIQSHAIESRFGRIRQLSGANYFISKQQLLESDCKLRTLSLVKYSHISALDIGQAARASHTADHDSIAIAETLYNDLQFNILPTENDLGIIYYVAGYCCRSLVRSNKCDKYKKSTISDFNNDAEDMISETAHEFFSDINRGGLWKPTRKLFDVGYLCWRVFAQLSRESLSENFLKATNQRNVFKKIVVLSFYEGEIVSPLSIAEMCENGPNILEGISVRFFSTMCKNLLRQLNDVETAITVRKVRKLTRKNASN